MPTHGKTSTTSTPAEGRLRITEIFYSLQGETRNVGLPTVFIRLTGCPLRCGYCDTSYAFQGGEWQTLDAVLDTAASYATPYVVVTGGEPLAQQECHQLLTRLCDKDYEVFLETSGAIDLADVDPRVVKVMDIKTPGSGEVEKNLEENLNHLHKQDQIKFVLCDRADYDWAVKRLRAEHLEQYCEVLFSTSYAQLDNRQLADWILVDQLPVRLQIQLHKQLWGNEPGR